MNKSELLSLVNECVDECLSEIANATQGPDPMDQPSKIKTIMSGIKTKVGNDEYKLFINTTAWLATTKEGQELVMKSRAPRADQKTMQYYVGLVKDEVAKNQFKNFVEDFGIKASVIKMFNGK